MIKEIDAPQLAQWLEANECCVVDVRELREIAGGTIPGAQAMPLATVPLRINELAKDQKIVMICHSGARSAQACMFLRQQGYTDVHNLRGGVLSWAGNRLPIKLPKSA
jgi:rhodanese-related sulfurtransferase